MNDALLDNLVDELNVQMEKVKLCIEKRAKRGLFAASSVPISMTGPNPKRKDPTARFAKVSDKSSDNSPFIKLPQPEYTMLPNCEVDTVCIPDLYDEDPSSSSQPTSSASASGGYLHLFLLLLASSLPNLKRGKQERWLVRKYQN